MPDEQNKIGCKALTQNRVTRRGVKELLGRKWSAVILVQQFGSSLDLMPLLNWCLERRLLCHELSI